MPAATTLTLANSAPVHVTANPKDVFRILFNLIHNAVGVARAAGTPRRIELALEQTGATVTIRIADDGPGLPDDVRARLFRRGRSTTGGNGYGLSIARELAERNGPSWSCRIVLTGRNSRSSCNAPIPTRSAVRAWRERRR